MTKHANALAVLSILASVGCIRAPATFPHARHLHELSEVTAAPNSPNVSPQLPGFIELDHSGGHATLSVAARARTEVNDPAITPGDGGAASVAFGMDGFECVVRVAVHDLEGTTDRLRNLGIGLGGHIQTDGPVFAYLGGGAEIDLLWSRDQPAYSTIVLDGGDVFLPFGVYGRAGIGVAIEPPASFTEIVAFVEASGGAALLYQEGTGYMTEFAWGMVSVGAGATF